MRMEPMLTRSRLSTHQNRPKSPKALLKPFRSALPSLKTRLRLELRNSWVRLLEDSLKQPLLAIGLTLLCLGLSLFAWKLKQVPLRLITPMEGIDYLPSIQKLWNWTIAADLKQDLLLSRSNYPWFQSAAAASNTLAYNKEYDLLHSQ